MAWKLMLASWCSTELPRRMACCTSWRVSPAAPPAALRATSLALALALQAKRGGAGSTGSSAGVFNRPLGVVATSLPQPAARELGSVARIAGHPNCLLRGAAMLVALALATRCQRGVKVRGFQCSIDPRHLYRPAAMSARRAHSRVAGYIAQAGSASRDI